MTLPEDQEHNIKVSAFHLQNPKVVAPSTTLKSSAFQYGWAAYLREKSGKWRGRGDRVNARMHKYLNIYFLFPLTACLSFNYINQGSK